MKATRRNAMAVSLLTVSLVAACILGASAVDVTLLTNRGGRATGTLTGLAPLIQLRAPDEVTVIGPMQQYDIPLTSIRQIAVDFPRLVIETDVGVVIGPYSAFGGIDEALILSPDADPGTLTIPFTSVRAIAFHGSSLRAVPREWMGDHFLSTPEIVAASPLQIETCSDCKITAPTSPVSVPADTTPIWNTITPEIPIEEPAEFPWWLGMVGVAALVLIIYFLGSNQSST